MSGGSYSYLCFKDAADLFEYNQTEELERMASRLLELGFDDAAKETLNLLYTVKQAKARVEVMQKRLKGVFQSVEWYDSADSGIGEVERAMKVYRGEI